MSKKDIINSVNENVQNIQSEFTKEQIVFSARFHNRRDLLNVLLDRDEMYTIETVEKIINDYMKGKVK